jgi:hypothetical protein
MIFIQNSKLSLAKSAHLKALKPILEKRVKKVTPHPLRIFLTSNLDSIISGDPSIIISIDLNFKSSFGSGYSKIIEAIFNYRTFVKKTTQYCAYDLARNLEIPVCPYCNRDYTITVGDGTTWLTRPEFDHFLCKSNHPLLALSFYNLIPSCHTCNCTFKKTKSFSLKTYLHPYVDNHLSDFTFEITPKDLASATGTGENFTIDPVFKCTGASKAKIENSLKIFRIVEVYSGHKSLFKRLLYSIHSTSFRYLEILEKTFPGISRDEVYRIAFSTELEKTDFYKAPFSKITRDILASNNVIN